MSTPFSTKLLRLNQELLSGAAGRIYVGSEKVAYESDIISASGVLQTGINVLAANAVTGITADGGSALHGVVNFSGQAGITVSNDGQNVIINSNALLHKDNVLFKTLAVTNGVDTEAFAFGTTFATVPKVVCTLRNDSEDVVLVPQISGISTSGFTALFSNTIPSANYKLEVYVANTGDNPGGGAGGGGSSGGGSNLGVIGYASTTLAGSDVTLTADTSKLNQGFNGTVTTGVSIVLAAPTTEGREFRLALDDINISGTTKTLSIKSNTTVLTTYDASGTSGILNGFLLCVATGSAGWRIMSETVTVS